MLVGLSGYARSGKDSLGSFLVKNHGFKRYAFADVLRDCAYALDPYMVQENPDTEQDEPVRLTELVDALGWEEAKKNPEVRRTLQRLGTEAGRQVLGDDVWVNAVFSKFTKEDDVVLTDVRFPNEASRVKAEGGYVIRIRRPDVVAINSHPSEVSLDEWPFDFLVVNDSSLDALEERAGKLVQELSMHHHRTNNLPGYGQPIIR